MAFTVLLKQYKNVKNPDTTSDNLFCFQQLCIN